MYTWMIPLMIAICAVLIHMLNNSNNTSNDFQDINWPIIIFKIIVWAHVVGLFFFYFGHVIYVLGRGKDFAFFSFVFLIVSTFSQAMMLILITFCAYGWMTTYRVSDNQEVYYPLCKYLHYHSHRRWFFESCSRLTIQNQRWGAVENSYL